MMSSNHEKLPKAIPDSDGASMRLAISEAGCDRKTAPTSTISPTEKMRISCFIPGPR